jgi:hypothetical protein
VVISNNVLGGLKMKAKAAVAWEAKKPLSIEMVEVMGPKEGEVLLKVINNYLLIFIKLI